MCHICQPHVVGSDQQTEFQMALTKLFLGNWILSHPNVTALNYLITWTKDSVAKPSLSILFIFFLLWERGMYAGPFWGTENLEKVWSHFYETHYSLRNLAFQAGSSAGVYRLTDHTLLRSTRRKSMQTWHGMKMAHTILLYDKSLFASLSLPSSSMLGNTEGPIAF